jgi:hypothetical protein
MSLKSLAQMAVAGILVAVAAGCGSEKTSSPDRTQPVPTSTAQLAPTSSHLFAPFNGGGVAAGVQVSKNAKGYCWEGSIADTRPDAWRCFLGNNILDPCFSNETGTSAFVLCADSPWSGVTKLTLTKGLPRSLGNPEANDPTSGRPWAIALADGKQCVALTGATGVIAGLGIDYGCTGGGVLAGLPRRASGSWTIFYAQGFKAKALNEHPIAEAWW